MACPFITLAQLLTTLYGGILTIKISLFLVTIAISTYHAFFLRTRLVYAMTQPDPSAVAVSGSLDARGEEPRAVVRVS